jgi:hypothetical protein
MNMGELKGYEYGGAERLQILRRRNGMNMEELKGYKYGGAETV